MFELHCEECGVFCSQSFFSGEHQEHKGVEILKILTSKTKIIKKDLQEIEKFFSPKYQELSQTFQFKMSMQENTPRD